MNQSDQTSILKQAQAQMFVVRAPAVVCAAAIGALDISVGFSYLVGVEVSSWYALTLVLKVTIIAMLKIPGRTTLRLHLPALFAVTAILAISCLSYGAKAAVWMAAMGFVLHLVATLAALRRDALSAYLRAIALVGTGTALVYVAMALGGLLEDHFGRYYFFGGSHPNLGSEILAMAAVAASMSLGSRTFFIASAPMLVAVALMQGRAALLVVLLAVGLRILRHFSGRRRGLALGFGFAGILLVPALLSESVRGRIASIVGAALMTDDPYRGAGTGFVGRSDRWQIAWDAFLDKPLFGQGFGFYETTGIASAHNFYMYSLAELGLLSVAMLCYVLWCLARIAKYRIYDLVLLSPVFILTMFNDRFMSLNPYPFVLFVLVLTMSVRRTVGPYTGAGSALETNNVSLPALRFTVGEARARS